MLDPATILLVVLLVVGGLGVAGAVYFIVTTGRRAPSLRTLRRLALAHIAIGVLSVLLILVAYLWFGEVSGAALIQGPFFLVWGLFELRQLDARRGMRQ